MKTDILLLPSTISVNKSDFKANDEKSGEAERTWSISATSLFKQTRKAVVKSNSKAFLPIIKCICNG